VGCRVALGPEMDSLCVSGRRKPAPAAGPACGLLAAGWSAPPWEGCARTACQTKRRRPHTDGHSPHDSHWAPKTRQPILIFRFLLPTITNPMFPPPFLGGTNHSALATECFVRRSRLCRLICSVRTSPAPVFRAIPPRGTSFGTVRDVSSPLAGQLVSSIDPASRKVQNKDYIPPGFRHSARPPGH